MKCLLAALGIMVLAPATAGAQPAQSRTEADSRFEAGIRSLAENKLDEAEQAFNRVREIEPERLRWLAGTVQVLVRRQKQDEAVRLVRAEAEKNPVARDARLALADAAREAGMPDLALEILQKALPEVEPGSRGAAEIYVRLGEVSLRQKRWEDALGWLRKAKEILPDSPVVLLRLAAAMEGGGIKEGLEPVYRDLLRIQPGNWVVMNNLAFLLAEKGQLDSALVFARRAHMAVPDSPEVNDTLGFVYAEKRLTSLAIVTLAESVQRSPGNMDFRKHLADALDQRKDTPAEMKSVTAALRDKDTPDAKVLELIQPLREKR